MKQWGLEKYQMPILIYLILCSKCYPRTWAYFKHWIKKKKKKKAANDSGVRCETSLLVKDLNLFGVSKMRLRCNSTWPLTSTCRSIPSWLCTWANHSVAVAFSVHHPPAQSHAWHLDLKVNVPKFNEEHASLSVGCFHMPPAVTKHFLRSFLVAFLHIYKPCSLRILVSPICPVMSLSLSQMFTCMFFPFFPSTRPTERYLFHWPF